MSNQEEKRAMQVLQVDVSFLDAIANQLSLLVETVCLLLLTCCIPISTHSQNAEKARVRNPGSLC